jgi:hypothetical protein
MATATPEQLTKAEADLLDNIIAMMDQYNLDMDDLLAIAQNIADELDLHKLKPKQQAKLDMKATRDALRGE